LGSAEHRDPQHRLTWAALVDGNLTQLDSLQKANWASMRIHGRVKRQVEELFQEEKPY
jgi:hypothetical protein